MTQTLTELSSYVSMFVTSQLCVSAFRNCYDCTLKLGSQIAYLLKSTGLHTQYLYFSQERKKFISMKFHVAFQPLSYLNYSALYLIFLPFPCENLIYRKTTIQNIYKCVYFKSNSYSQILKCLNHTLIYEIKLLLPSFNQVFFKTKPSNINFYIT